MPDFLSIIIILVFAFFFMASLAPFEALGWWAGWYDDDIEPKTNEISKSDRNNFVVFLTGIHSVSEDTYARREIRLLDSLKEKLPESQIIEVFPYSASNRELTGERFFAWFWKTALKLKMNRLSLAGLVINLRNIFQVTVSADSRYGPIYNQGMAASIYTGLLENAYITNSKTPITIIGYSGGGQIAVGAAGYLKQIVKAPISVISLGGILASDASLLRLEHMHHLIGKKDRVQRLGYIFFPGRWPIIQYSSWNQAKNKGIVKFVDMGAVDHTGKNGYLDGKAKLPDGRSNFEQTVDIIVEIIKTNTNKNVVEPSKSSSLPQTI